MDTITPHTEEKVFIIPKPSVSTFGKKLLKSLPGIMNEPEAVFFIVISPPAKKYATYGNHLIKS